MLDLNTVDCSLTARSFLSLHSVQLCCTYCCTGTRGRLKRAACPLLHVKRPSRQAGLVPSIYLGSCTLSL
ncbi:hypothetical protein [Diadegma fenestrale ichnovirus]|nr:hypothetical protein [Diadegma fenestrale ichnovirus]